MQRLIAFKLTNTPEGVAVWLTVRAQWPDVLPANIWHDQDPLSKKERTRLAKILKEDFRTMSENSGDENIKSAAANPNPIFAWNTVLSEVLQREEKEFPQFWLDTVDSKLNTGIMIFRANHSQTAYFPCRVHMSANPGASSYSLT